VNGVGFLLNLSFPAEAHHVTALRDVVAQAARQAGWDEQRARDFADEAAALLTETAGHHASAGTMTITVEPGPPIQVICAGRRLTLENPAEAGPHTPT